MAPVDQGELRCLLDERTELTGTANERRDAGREVLRPRDFDDRGVADDPRSLLDRDHQADPQSAPELGDQRLHPT
jgi:hypothetical protein